MTRGSSPAGNGKNCPIRSARCWCRRTPGARPGGRHDLSAIGKSRRVGDPRLLQPRLDHPCRRERADPQVHEILIRSGAYWKLQGVQVSPESAGSLKAGTLIDLQSHGFHGPVHDIVVENCRAESVRDSSPWTVQDWNTLAWNAIQVDGTNMTVRDCTFRNVDFGISVTAADSMIERNTVENFAGDGLRGLGDNTTFQYNTVKNCYDVNQNHDDGFQSWSRGVDGRVGGGEVRGIVLRGNTIINFEDPQQPHRGALQGIGCFDGMFVDWVVENNVIITDHYHGITLSGARNCRIVNNTVLDRREGRPGPPWICIGNHKNGTPSAGCIIRNNLTTALNVGAGVTADHNLIVEDPNAHFADAAAYDLRLNAGSKAIDAGTPDLGRRKTPPERRGLKEQASTWAPMSTVPLPVLGTLELAPSGNRTQFSSCYCRGVPVAATTGKAPVRAPTLQETPP